MCGIHASTRKSWLSTRSREFQEPTIYSHKIKTAQRYNLTFLLGTRTLSTGGTWNSGFFPTKCHESDEGIAPWNRAVHSTYFLNNTRSILVRPGKPVPFCSRFMSAPLTLRVIHCPCLPCNDFRTVVAQVRSGPLWHPMAPAAT